MIGKVSDIAVKILVITLVLSLLPMSPFSGFEYLVENLPFLSFVNWFVPISEILVITETWLVVVAVYYGILYLVNYAVSDHRYLHMCTHIYYSCIGILCLYGTCLSPDHTISTMNGPWQLRSDSFRSLAFQNIK